MFRLAFLEKKCRDSLIPRRSGTNLNRGEGSLLVIEPRYQIKEPFMGGTLDDFVVLLKNVLHIEQMILDNVRIREYADVVLRIITTASLKAHE